MLTGTLPHHAAAMIRLYNGVATTRGPRSRWSSPVRRESSGRPTTRGCRSVGAGFLVRQAACIGGGTTEMARNVISERLLGMPRETRNDGGPFRDVPRGPQSGGARG